MARGRRQRRHAHPVAHRGPDRGELLAVLVLLAVALAAGLGAPAALARW